MTKEVIERAANLKVISRTGVGVDNVDVKAATEKGILVLNTPEANSISVAEHTLALIVAISKQLVMYDSELRAGNFAIRRTNRSVDIDGKTLGLIGCGRIGRFTAEKCKAAFNMNVIGYDPYIKELPGITLYENIEDVFAKADYISLHLPLTDETRNMVGESLLSKMKPTAFLINTSRGGIVDEAALARMLKEERIAGAALDVLESEPPKADNPLLPLKNVILTPHSAALTKECSARVAHEAALGISDYLKGKTPKFVFNKELLT
jgi:D-3-phosphoglycerate dehydrogenase